MFPVDSNPERSTLPGQNWTGKHYSQETMVKYFKWSSGSRISTQFEIPHAVYVNILSWFVWSIIVIL